MRRWKERNRSVLFISHRLAEVRVHCDMCTVLRDGRDVASFIPGEGGEAQIVSAMLGEAATVVRDEVRARTATVATADRPVLEAEHVGAGRQLEDVSLAVSAGEVLGLVALEGQGQETLFEILAGDRKAERGRLLIEGRAGEGAAPLRRHPRGRGARTCGPPPRPAAAALDPGEHRRAAVQPRRQVGSDQRSRGAPAGAGGRRPAVDRHPRREPGAAPVRGQPAEGHHRPLAGPRVAGDAAVRPDARHRRRYQASGLRPRPRPRRRGHGDRHVHQRAARGGDGLRPLRGAAQRSHRRRAPRGRRGERPAVGRPRTGGGVRRGDHTRVVRRGDDAAAGAVQPPVPLRSPAGLDDRRGRPADRVAAVAGVAAARLRRLRDPHHHGRHDAARLPGDGPGRDRRVRRRRPVGRGDDGPRQLPVGAVDGGPGARRVPAVRPARARSSPSPCPP